MLTTETEKLTLVLGSGRSLVFACEPDDQMNQMSLSKTLNSQLLQEACPCN